MLLSRTLTSRQPWTQKSVSDLQRTRPYPGMRQYHSLFVVTTTSDLPCRQHFCDSGLCHGFAWVSKRGQHMAEIAKDLGQRWLNFSEAERYSGLSESTLRRLIESKRLRVFRPTERKVLIDRGELDSLIEASVGN